MLHSLHLIVMCQGESISLHLATVMGSISVWTERRLATGPQRQLPKGDEPKIIPLAQRVRSCVKFPALSLPAERFSPIDCARMPREIRLMLNQIFNYSCWQLIMFPSLIWGNKNTIHTRSFLSGACARGMAHGRNQSYASSFCVQHLAHR